MSHLYESEHPFICKNKNMTLDPETREVTSGYRQPPQIPSVASAESPRSPLSNPPHDVSSGRQRAHSFETSPLSYSSRPLLVPQTSPPMSLRSLSLSPRRQNKVFPFDQEEEKPVPQEYRQQQRAMEMAIQNERQRTKDLESKEKDIEDVNVLKKILKQERHRMAHMAGELAKLKQATVGGQAEAERIEEGRINGLMRRLDTLQLEKGKIIVELEREEEMLTNTLQKKLDQVRKEKMQLEKLIEREQSHHSRLESKLSDIRGGKAKHDKPVSTPHKSDVGAVAEVASTGVATQSVTSANPHQEVNRIAKAPPMGSLEEDPDEEEEIYEDEEQNDDT